MWRRWTAGRMPPDSLVEDPQSNTCLVIPSINNSSNCRTRNCEKRIRCISTQLFLKEQLKKLSLYDLKIFTILFICYIFELLFNSSTKTLLVSYLSKGDSSCEIWLIQLYKMNVYLANFVKTTTELFVLLAFPYSINKFETRTGTYSYNFIYDGAKKKQKHTQAGTILWNKRTAVLSWGRGSLTILNRKTRPSTLVREFLCKPFIDYSFIFWGGSNLQRWIFLLGVDFDWIF